MKAPEELFQSRELISYARICSKRMVQLRKRTRLSIFLAYLSLTLLLQGCSALQAYEPDVTGGSSDAAETTFEKISDEGEKTGGTLRLYLKKINSANPLFASDVYLSDLYSLVFESLFYLTRKIIPSALLAKSQTISEMAGMDNSVEKCLLA